MKLSDHKQCIICGKEIGKTVFDPQELDFCQKCKRIEESKADEWLNTQDEWEDEETDEGEI